MPPQCQLVRFTDARIEEKLLRLWHKSRRTRWSCCFRSTLKDSEIGSQRNQRFMCMCFRDDVKARWVYQSKLFLVFPYCSRSLKWIWYRDKLANSVGSTNRLVSSIKFPHHVTYLNFTHHSSSLVCSTGKSSSEIIFPFNLEHTFRSVWYTQLDLKS